MKKENEDPKFSDDEKEEERKPSFMPQGLSQIAKLNPPTSTLRKVSKPSASSVKLLPDISDDSDDEEEEGAKESADVVGSILVKGMKTGVFNNVDEFQHELIKNKMRMKEKRQMKNQEKDAATKAPAEVKLEKNISCNTVSSSSEEVKEPEAKESKNLADEPKETEEEKKARLEREEAKRLVEQRERELEKLEEKRKMMETFYKNRQLSIDSNMPTSKKRRESPEEEVTVVKEQSWAKEPSQTIVISDDGDKRSPRSSDDSEEGSSGDGEHRRKRRKSGKHRRRSGSGSRKRSR